MTNEKRPPVVEGLAGSDVVRLYLLLSGTNSLDEFLHELAGVAADRLDRQLACGVTVELDGQGIAVASSDDFAAALDQVQYRARASPCLTAVHEQRIIELTDAAEFAPWPEWRDYALANGLRKMLSVPLWAIGDVLGALNLYSRSAVDFTEADRLAAVSFAAQAGGAVAVAARLAHQAELVSHLEKALTSRAVIDQAKGILMAEQRCRADEAFELLRQASQHRNVKLREVAEQIVAQVSRREG